MIYAGSSTLAAALREAVLLLRSGDPAQALSAFNALLVRAPQNAACLHGRGLALNALGLRAEALDDFRSACVAEPDSWAAAASIADITPDEAERLTALEQSAEALLRLCGADPPARIFNAAASALADAHRFEELSVFAQQHADRFCDRARASDWCAKASYDLGDFGAAFEWQQDALLRTEPGTQPEPSQRFRTEIALAALHEIADCFEDLDLPVFLVAGTLLGFWRNGQPLAHDRDVDIGLLCAPGASPDLAGIIRRHPRLVLPRRARPGDSYLGLTHRGIAVDIFAHEIKDAHVTCGVSERRGDIRWRYSAFDLEPYEIAGRRFHLPDDADLYLSETYGPGWRSQDEGYSSAVSSPALDGVDIRVRSFYAAARARAALQMGEILRARALARQSPFPLRLPAWLEG